MKRLKTQASRCKKGLEIRLGFDGQTCGIKTVKAVGLWLQIDLVTGLAREFTGRAHH
jgi:hypothetical protein